MNSSSVQIMLTELGTLARFEGVNPHPTVGTETYISPDACGSRKLSSPLQDKRGAPWNTEAQLTPLEPPLPLQSQCA